MLNANVFLGMAQDILDVTQARYSLPPINTNQWKGAHVRALHTSFYEAFPGVSEHAFWAANQMRTPGLIGRQTDDDRGGIIEGTV
jgi:hypothetical protein